MKEFMMIFRTEKADQSKPSPEQMQAMIKQWQDWIGGIYSKQSTEKLFLYSVNYLE